MLKTDIRYIGDYSHRTSNSMARMTEQKPVAYSLEEWKQKSPFSLHPFRSFE
jgi:hypothetical protein